MVLQIMAEKISNYKFDDINVGQRKKFSVSITETMVNEFAKITGDYNPLHMDENYAQNTPFRKRI